MNPGDVESSNGATYAQIKEEHMKNPAVKMEYDALGLKCVIVSALVGLRREKSWTQAELAEEMHTTTSVISRMENGNHNFSLDTIEKIAALLGKTPLLSFE